MKSLRRRDRHLWHGDVWGISLPGKQTAGLVPVSIFFNENKVISFQHTIIERPVKHLENIKHGNSSLQRIGVVRWYEIGYQCCLNNESGLGTEYSDRHKLGTWEEIHNECAHDVDTQCECEPTSGIEELLHGRETQIFVESWTVIYTQLSETSYQQIFGLRLTIDNEHTGTLNDTRRPQC